MPSRFDLIVFDWDGTLANSTEMIIDCIRAASADTGLPVPERSAASHIIGLGLLEAARVLFGNLPGQQLQQLMERYHHYYYERDESTPLFDGAFTAIAHLSQAKFLLAVATGKGRRGLDRALKNSGLAPYINASRCVDECHSKPHPQMLQELMGELGVAPERTLMIGDTSHDLQMAVNAGVASLGVTYGAHPLSQLKPLHPLACFDRFEQLNQWLLENA